MKTIWFLLRFGFGVLFVFSGALKLKDPILFAEAVRNFRIIGDPIAPAMALFIPWVEIFAGIAVMTERFARGGAFILVGLLFVFTGAIGISWARGLDISCGCFGDNGPVNYPVKIAQNLGLIAWGVLVWFKAEMDSVEPAVEMEGEVSEAAGA